jgi:predicted enzyme related to lactoylglutathione lyase
MSKPVVHFEIAGINGGKTRDFYAKLFNWEYQLFGEGNDYGMVSPGGPNSIGGGVSSVPPGGKPYVTFYVQVEDLQASLNKAESLGGKTVLPPTPIPGMGAFAWFSDPDGNMLGIFKSGE